MSATGFLVLLIVTIAILMVLIMKVKLHPTFALFLSALFPLFPLDSHAFLMAFISATRGFVDLFPAFLHSAKRRALCN